MAPKQLGRALPAVGSTTDVTLGRNGGQCPPCAMEGM